MGHGDDDLADVSARLHVAVRVGDLGEVEGAVDHRREGTGGESRVDERDRAAQAFGVPGDRVHRVHAARELRVGVSVGQRRRTRVERAVDDQVAAGCDGLRDGLDAGPRDRVERQPDALAAGDLLDAGGEVLVVGDDDVGGTRVE